MAIIAVCPYCGKGKVRAPNGSEGMSANCPSCRTSFTIIVSEALGKGPARTGDGTAIVAAPGAVEAPSTVMNALPATAPAETAENPFVFGLALVAITLAGVGIAASQFPYGRIATVALTIIGLFLGLCSLLLADRKPTVPGLAAAFNLIGLIVAVFLPGWLGLTSWRPPEPVIDVNRVQAVGLDNSVPTPAAEWVDVSAAAWQLDDVRITVPGVSLAPVELIGPKEKKAVTKEKALQIWLRLANVGVARRIEFRGWDQFPPPEKPAPKLTDAAGQVLAVKTFEPDWVPPGRPEARGLFPGKMTEQLLLFEPPETVGDLRLELPAEAFGGTQPAKLLIPRTYILHRTTR